MKLLNRLINRLADTNDETMTEYMSDEHDSTDPFEETNLNLSRTERIRTMPGRVDRVEKTVVENVEKIYRTVKTDGDLSTMDKPPQSRRRRLDDVSTDDNVAQACSLPSGSFNRDQFYYLHVGPVASSCEELEWTSAYSLDISEAVGPGGEEFRDITSDFNIRTQNRTRELVPEFILKAYEYLVERAEVDGRPVHQWELEFSSGPTLANGSYSIAFDYFEELPGVEPPSETIAWEYTPAQEASVSDTYAQDSGSQSGKKAGEKP